MAESGKRAKGVRRLSCVVTGDDRVPDEDGAAAEAVNPAARHGGAARGRQVSVERDRAVHQGNGGREREESAAFTGVGCIVWLDYVIAKGAVDNDHARAAARHSAAPRFARLHTVEIEGAIPNHSGTAVIIE